MAATLEIKLPSSFSFRHTVESHGWYDLPPFEHTKGSNHFRYVFQPAGNDPAISALVRKGRSSLTVELSEKPDNISRIVDGVRHILRLDDDLSGFYEALITDERLSWI